MVYIACPNYLRFYEPHYKIFWLPLMPKILGRLYLRLRGRSSVMLDQVTYTTNRRIRSLLYGLGGDHWVLDLPLAISQKASGRLAAEPSTRFVSKLAQIPLFGSLVLALTLRFGSVRQEGCEGIVAKSAQPTN